MKPTIIKLQKQLREIQEKIQKYQNKCPHKDLFKEYRGDTGNYNPSNDRYWIEFHCLDCDKKWMEDHK